MVRRRGPRGSRRPRGRSSTARLSWCVMRITAGGTAGGAWRPSGALVGALAATLLVSVGVWQFGPGGAPSDGVIVRSASTGDPGATVMVYGTPERDVAVVWVLGLDAK